MVHIVQIAQTSQTLTAKVDEYSSRAKRRVRSLVYDAFGRKLKDSAEQLTRNSFASRTNDYTRDFSPFCFAVFAILFVLAAREQHFVLTFYGLGYVLFFADNFSI